MDIIKIGGSIITYKNGYCSPNVNMIKKYADVLKKITKSRDIIIILGGGSYGNAVPLKYNLLNKHTAKKEDVYEMTKNMFFWVTLFCDILKMKNIPVYPIQLSNTILASQSSIESTNFQIIDELRSFGITPVLSGDLIFSSDRKNFHIYSSDYVPLALQQEYKIDNFITLTNVDGIKKEDTIIDEITSKNWNKFLRYAKNSNQQDVTGGMKTKLDSLINIAHNGTNCFVVNGNNPNNLLRFYSQSLEKVTKVKKGNYNDYINLWN
ncbi:isopentenyl phosphate kinase [Staphylococcus hominis]|uniref:isopentenyl phosphate kinase n=1 Tax=Staphylococcus hominis TaxID=1290 RepID=UPI001370AB85|nr:isopentenyl phosphate kinase [Staphylococcus hominis]NAM96359.1 hypothetical protein [Staphylococcus hominis]